MLKHSLILLSITSLFIGCQNSNQSDKTDIKPTTTKKITVAPLNQTPIATFDSFSISKDKKYEGELTAIDPDGDSVGYVIVDKPQHGSVTLHENGCFTYTPNKGYQGEDSFSYKVSDDLSSCAIKKVTIDVCNPTIKPPLAPSDLFIKSLSPTKLELTWSDNSDDEEGFVIYQDGKLVATTNANESRKVICQGLNPATTYSFEVKAKNKAGTSSPAKAKATTKDITTPPLAPTNLKAISVDKRSLRLKWQDNANNENSYEIYQNDKLLKTISTNCSCTIIKDLTPNTTYIFKVIAVNKIGKTSSNTIEIKTKGKSIPPINQAPIAIPKTITIDSDSNQTIKLMAVDQKDDKLSYTIVIPPKHGTYKDGVYTPDRGFYGSDTITFKANDGELDSKEQTITITILPKPKPNTPPTAISQTITILQDTKREITLTATDKDDDNLTYTITKQPKHGTYKNNIYTPNKNFTGKDSITYIANDGKLDSDEATITINITAKPTPNQAPIALEQNITIDEDQSKKIKLLATDPEDNKLTFTIITKPKHGSYKNSIYTPDKNFYGSDSFTYKANDGKLDSNEATISITINPINDKPTIMPQTLTIDEDKNVTLKLKERDIDGDKLTYSVVNQPQHGTYKNGIYTPDKNYYGSDSFTIKANDGKIDSNIVTITITIKPTNDKPIAKPQTITIDQDTNTTIKLTATDSEDDNLTYTITKQPKHGTYKNSIYTPNKNFTGEDTITFKANDGKADSNEATITIKVKQSNKPEVINGYTLPPEPDPKINNSTLLGIDSNNNGVRDDVERWIIKTLEHGEFQNNLYVTDKFLQKAKNHQKRLANEDPTPQEVLKLYTEELDILDCLFTALIIEGKDKKEKELRIKFRDKLYNTHERLENFFLYENRLPLSEYYNHRNHGETMNEFKARRKACQEEYINFKGGK